MTDQHPSPCFRTSLHRRTQRLHHSRAAAKMALRRNSKSRSGAGRWLPRFPPPQPPPPAHCMRRVSSEDDQELFARDPAPGPAATAHTN